MDVYYKEVLDILSYWKENSTDEKCERFRSLLHQYPCLRRITMNKLLQENFRQIYTSNFDNLIKLLIGLLHCSYNHDTQHHRDPLYKKMISELSFMNIRLFFHSQQVHWYFKLELFHCILNDSHLDSASLDYDILCTELGDSLLETPICDLHPDRHHISELNQQILHDINKYQQNFSPQTLLSLSSLSKLLSKPDLEPTPVELPELETEVLINILNMVQGPKDLFIEIENSEKILWEQFLFLLVVNSQLEKSARILYEISKKFTVKKVMGKLLEVYRTAGKSGGLWVLSGQSVFELIVHFQLEIVNFVSEENMGEMIEQMANVANQLQNHNSQFFLKGFIKKRNVTTNEHNTSELFIETVVERMLSKLSITQGVTLLSMITKIDTYIVEQFLEYYLCEYFYYYAVLCETDRKFWREISSVVCNGLLHSTSTHLLIKCIITTFSSLKSFPILNPLVRVHSQFFLISQLFNHKKIEFLYVYLVELQRKKEFDVMYLVESEGLCHILFDVASWLHYKQIQSNKEIVFCYRDWFENLLKRFQPSHVIALFEERSIYEYPVAMDTLKNINPPPEFIEKVQEIKQRLEDLDNWRMVVPSSISQESVSFYTENPLYVNLVHLFQTSREDLFYFISELNGNEKGKELWRLFIENIIKLPFPQYHNKKLHVLFLCTLIARNVPGTYLLQTCVTPLSSALQANISKFFPAPTILATIQDFSPLRLEMLINEYLISCSLPDLNHLTFVLLEFAIQSFSQNFLESIKALIVLFQDWIVLDVIENRFKQLFSSSMDLSVKKCWFFAATQILLLFEIDWNNIFSPSLCNLVHISDISMPETQVIAWLLDSIPSISNAYILLQRIVYLVTRTTDLNKKYWISLLKNHVNKDISLSKFTAKNEYIAIHDTKHLIYDCEYLNYCSSTGDSDILLFPPFSRWLYWELFSQTPCDMQYYFILIEHVFLPLQYQKDTKNLVKDFFKQLVYFVETSPFIHFEIIVLFQYFAQQCEDIYWLLDILASFHKKMCFKIISLIPFQQLIPATDINVLAVSLQKIGGVFQEHKSVPLFQCFLKAFAFLLAEGNESFAAIIKEFLTQLFKQIPAIERSFSKLWNKEFLVISGMEASIPILESIIPEVEDDFEVTPVPSNFIDQIMANPHSFDMLRTGKAIDSPKYSVQGTLLQVFNKRALSSESSDIVAQNRKRAKLVEQLFQLEAPKLPQIQEQKQFKQQKFNNKVAKKAEKPKKQ